MQNYLLGSGVAAGVGTGIITDVATDASCSPTSNRLVTATVCSRAFDVIQAEPPASVTGAGLTFDLIYAEADPTVAGGCISYWRAMSASPATGVITATWTHSMYAACIAVDETDNVDTTGTNGSGAIVQSNGSHDPGGSATSSGVTLGAFGNAANGAKFATCWFQGVGTVATCTRKDANWTEGYDRGTLFASSAAAIAIETQFRASNDTTPTGTWSAGGFVHSVAFEIKASVAAGALAAAAADVASASAALTTQVRMAAGAADAASASAAVTTATRLAASAAGLAVASGVLSAGSAFSASAKAVVGAAVGLVAQIRAAVAASGAGVATGALTDWTTVTLAAPLYTGPGGVLGPDVDWGGSPPGVGSVLYYDGTHVLISPNGEVSADSNVCQAEVQYFDGTTWHVVTLVITPQLVARPGALSSATAQLTGAIRLAAVANALGAVVAAFSTGAGLVATASGATSSSTALTTALRLQASAQNLASATDALTAQILMTASPTGQASATASFGGVALMTAVATALAGASAYLSSAKPLLAASTITTAAGGTLVTGLGNNITAIVFGCSMVSAVLSTKIPLQAFVASELQLIAALGSVHMTAGARFNIRRLRRRRRTISLVTYLRFETKDPEEKDKLTFDFGVELPAGVMLTGSPTVSIAPVLGTDPAPELLANGVAGLDATATQVIVPVQGGLDGRDYRFRVLCATTDPQIVAEMTGVLPVRA